MSMDEQARIEGSELDALLDIMKVISERRDITGTLRVCVDDGALKIKIDEGVWSPPIGYWDARSVPDKSHSVAPCPAQPICYCDGAGRHVRGENCVAP